MHSFVLLMSHNMREKLESFTSLWFTNNNVMATLADKHIGRFILGKQKSHRLAYTCTQASNHKLVTSCHVNKANRLRYRQK